MKKSCWCLFAGLMVAGCADLSEPTESVTSSMAVEESPAQRYDDHLVDLGRDLPGFAGISLNNNGDLVISLTQSIDAAVIRSRVAKFLEEHVFPGSELAYGRMRLLERLRVSSATFTFNELHTWYNKLAPAMLTMRSVVFGDIDEADNQIVFGITEPSAVEQLIGVVQEHGVPSDAVQFTVAARPSLAQLTLRDTVRPMLSGIQIKTTSCGHDGFTLGFNIAHRYVNGQLDPDEYFVTASHCTLTIGDVAVGQAAIAYQPDFDKAVAIEYADPPLFTNASDPACPPNRYCRYSDAALFKYTNTNWIHGYVAWPFCCETVGISMTRYVIAASSPLMNQPVSKIGRTSGLTNGAVIRTCAAFNMFNQSGFDMGITQLCQAQANFLVSSGDSGSPVVYLSPDGFLTDMGILWSSAGVFSTQDWVNYELRTAVGGGLGSTGSSR